MKLNQSWIGYLDRSYEQIKRSALKRLGIQAPEISDHSESNPLVILISLFAGVAEMLNLYIDNAAKESFIGTARRLSSVIKLARLIDYNIKARNPASADILFYLVDSGDNETPVNNPGSDILIPMGTTIKAPNSTLIFRLTKDVYLRADTPNVYGPAIEYTQFTDEILGVTDGTSLQKIVLPDKYVNNSLELFVDGVQWIEYRSFGYMLADTQGFVVNVDENKIAYLQFGDGLAGKIPLDSLTITANYRESEGVAANVPPDTLTDLSSGGITLPGGVNILATNPDYASGGLDFESIEDIKNRAPRSLRTLERAVTYQDYLDLPLLVPGVGAAAVRYCCGKYVDIFIAPSSRGIATRTLVNAVTDYMQCKVMITTRIEVQPAGLTRIWIQATIYGKPLIPVAEVRAQVLDELDNVFGFGNIEINQSISITDIIATVEKLSKVDRIEIAKVKIEPYARPLDATDNILNVTYVTLPTTTTKRTYRVVYRSGTNDFELYVNTYFIQLLAIGATFNDGILGFRINASSYTNGDSWEFSAFPSYPEIFPTTKITINDYSASLVDVGPVNLDGSPRTIFSNLSFISQGTASTCLPACD